MQRYFFHYQGSDDEVMEDRVGSCHPDLEAVEREAHQLAREILEEEIAEGGPVIAPRCLEITDENGEIVLYVPFWVSLTTKRPDALAGEI